MKPQRELPVIWSLTLLVCAVVGSVANAQGDGAKSEFFESRIRPVLVEHCYECHNSVDSAEGELALDHRAAMRAGGAQGAPFKPGKPGKSLLLSVLRHEIPDLEMPQGGPKLSESVLKDFEKWIADGAVDPRDRAPTEEELKRVTAWETVLERRKQWWSFRPIKNVNPPDVDDASWSKNTIDRFVRAKLEEQGLEPASTADPETLIRRLYFNLIGLPPSSRDSQAWRMRITDASTERERGRVLAELTDELLSSPRFGERWARHWMDWIRYAESHGSEGDPEITQAWRYRDYLIRALNADIPMDQLIREHIAGDLLEQPRVDKERGVNESAIGPAHWRMVFHGFAPTDALDEKVRFVDDQINAFSKAFLGLTVSCARCHDHKFDAISQKDYYALFGVLASCRPGRTVIDSPGGEESEKRQELIRLKRRIRAALARDWLESTADLDVRIHEQLWKRGEREDSVLRSYFLVQRDLSNEQSVAALWRRETDRFRREVEASPRFDGATQRWRLGRDEDYQEWFGAGKGLPGKPQAAGEFSIAPNGESALVGIYPRGVYSHAVSQKDPARLTSRDVTIGADLELWVRVIGDSGAAVRYVVQDYPRNGTVYPVSKLNKKWRWQRFDLSYWDGDDVHIELATAADAPLLTTNAPRSWFGIREAILVKKGAPAPRPTSEYMKPIVAASKTIRTDDLRGVASVYSAAIRSAVEAWRDEVATDEQAILLDRCLGEGLLSNRVDASPATERLIADYRRVEESLSVPVRVPGLDESTATNQRLFERGNHRLPGERVPRRFLEAFNPTPFGSHESGRRELAEQLLSQANPLTKRVMANRIWHHLFGQGLVATPDNLGRLGDQPSHPELLDWLASQLERDDWSMRRFIRRIVLSRTWRASAQASDMAKRKDPLNRFLSHANVRRMEAEAIRDALLSVSGRVEHRLEGPPVDGGANRRSVYVRVRRNSLDPFLRAFDFPEPFTAVGRRDVTNVPAQSLTMMNDARVGQYAVSWAQVILQNSSLRDEAERVRQMLRSALGRRATQTEIDRCCDYLRTTQSQMEERRASFVQKGQVLQEVEARMESILSPVRTRLAKEQRQGKRETTDVMPKAIARWDFRKANVEQPTAWTPQLVGGAKLNNGALELDGGGYAVTKPIPKTIQAKTLEAWVQLKDLSQRGGGVMTVQTPNGAIFDSIVFGERDPGEWLAGSDFFRRTQRLGGPKEEQLSRAVHVALTYKKDGTITAYRDGKRYGKPYKSDGPVEFAAGKAIVSFGVRHLPAGGNRMLAGRVIKANLYDRALTDDELAASASASLDYVTNSQVLKALSNSQRDAVARLTAERNRIQNEIRLLGDPPPPASELAVWSELARAIFTFKEFIYVR